MVTEERVVNLEATLAQFIEQTNLIVAAIHEDIAEIRASTAEIRASNARTDRQLLEMQQQAERERAQADKDRQQADKDRQQADKDRQQADKDRKDFNKRLAEISDSMGTLIEDMVAPCGFQLAKAVFQDEEAQTCAIRLRHKNSADPGQMMELDLLAVGPTKALVVEVKRRIDADKVTEYREKLARLPEFFPELAGKVILPAVASVYLDRTVIAFLNHQKVYGIAMGDEVMEVVNLGRF
jgi:hypothetical protein